MTSESRTPTWLWGLSVLFVVYSTTIPFHFVFDIPLALQKLSSVRLNPLISSATSRRVSTPDAVQNVLLFIPFGVFGA
ncbi:MAG: hypothetical protein ABI652_03620, partial [Acidobacteriota bacterium]